MIRRRTVLGLALAALPFLAQAQEPIRIVEPWARATIGQQRNSAAYMTIESRSADRLVAASSPLAGKVELHTHLHEGGVMKMREVDAIEVKPDSPTKLESGGLHVMLLDLKQPLKEGDTLPLTLVFEKAGKVDLSVPVHGLRAGPHRH